MQTYEIHLGFGKHISDIDPTHLSQLGLLDNVTASLGALGALWSKTSFAITLLRITEGRLKVLVWFILVSMSIAMWATAIITWLHCTPVSKIWEVELEGTCWPAQIVPDYNIASSGMGNHP